MDTQTLLNTIRANIAREQAEQAVNASELATWQALEVALLATPAQNRAPLPIPAFILPEGIVGVAYSAQLPDTTDPDGDPVSYIAAGLAPGLSLSGKLITGIPTQAGSFSPTFLASDGKLQSAVISVALVIKTPVVAPPAGNPLRILTPDYNGKTGAITFKSEGGNGSRIEYQALGVTDWSDNPNRQVDKGLYLEAQRQDKSITIRARQSGKEATPLLFVLKSTGVDSPGGVVPDKPGDKPTTDPVVISPLVSVSGITVYESLQTITD